MNEKDFLEKLKMFTLELNSHLESYVSASKIASVKLSFRIRATIKLGFEDRTGEWHFEDERTAEKIHKHMKELLLVKEMIGLKKQIEDDKK